MQREIGEAIERRVPERAELRLQLSVRCATLPSMKSKMLATSMITNASMNRPKPSAHAARDVDDHADQRQRVRVDAQRDARVDDRAQRKHADGADQRR